MDQVGNQIWDQVSDQVWDQVLGQVRKDAKNGGKIYGT